MINYIKTTSTPDAASPARTGRRAPKVGPRVVTRPTIVDGVPVSLRTYIRRCSDGVRIAAWTDHVA